MTFAEATRLDLDGDSLRGEIPPGWDIMGNANGGYLLALAARGATSIAGRPDPVTITGHFLRPAQAGPVSITGEVLKEGKRFATVLVRLAGKPGPLVVALATVGELSAEPGPVIHAALPPQLPPPEECVPIEPTDTFPPPFVGRIDLRLNPADIGGAIGRPTGEASMTGWFRLRDGEPLGTHTLVMATDSFPPTTFNLDIPQAWVPTIELTTHVRGRPTPGWLRCRFTTRYISDGFLEEDGEIWDEIGRLVAQSRQLALVPRG